jgi:hypothetical protein
MSDKPARLDESLNVEALRKSLTGNVNVEPDLSRLTISPSGQVQPIDSPPAPSHSSGSTQSPSSQVPTQQN